MSLDTVIKIGKFYREITDSWKYHDQINLVMNDVEALAKKKDKDGNKIETVFYEIPVIDKGDSFLFDIDNRIEIMDEDKRRSLYYLNFKTSKKDTSKKYLIGDLVYSHYIDKKGKLIESGNYRLEGKCSFDLAETISKEMKSSFIHKFRDEFRRNKEKIESLILSTSSVILNFDFNGKQWLDNENIIQIIDEVISNESIDSNEVGGKFILVKSLYRSLGTKETVSVTPGFKYNNAYKNRLFTKDEIVSLIYAGKAINRPIIKLFGNKIGITALPHSDKLKPLEIVDFFNRNKNDFETENEKESDLSVSVNSSSDSLFTNLIENKFSDEVKFDIVFISIPKSEAGVFADLLEISDVEKSHLKRIHDNIIKQKQKVEEQFRNESKIHAETLNLDLSLSFFKILGDITKEKKKFLFHLLKVLPQIYTDTYFHDPLILPVFIEKVERNIRSSGQQFNTLKYDFYFLMNIQKNNPMEKITNTKSYTLGTHLGTMARQFAAWRDDCPIKSFEKSYVGNLSRRISSIEELSKFASFINEKLIIHERAFKNEKEAYLNLVETIKSFGGEKYSKHNCSLGFFESYYKVETKSNKEINN